MIATTLAPGLILAVATRAGLELTGHGDKRTLCCPIHEDTDPSAFIDIQRNVFYCSVCTANRGWTAKRLAQELGVQWPPDSWSAGSRSRPRREFKWPKDQVRSAPPAPDFGAAEAQRAWDIFLASARDDDRVELDETAYAYLSERGLLDAWEERAFAIVPDDPSLPGDTGSWRHRGYAIAAPLYDSTGTIRNVQARAIIPRNKRQLVPKGSQTAGLAFANAAGLALLSGQWHGPKVVLLGEGLTDAMAYSFTSPMPTLCSPGTGMARQCIGPWAGGCTLLVATDADAPGRAVVAGISAAAYEFGANDVFEVTWPGGCQDACEVIRQRGAEALISFLDDLIREASNV